MEKVLITGCSSGFGYQTALLLDKNKFDVTATTRRQGFVFENTTIKHLYLDMQHLPESFEDYDIVSDEDNTSIENYTPEEYYKYCKSHFS